MALRVFHTADWHLGQTFHGFDRDYEHARFLGWLLDALADRHPDALVLAGDVFDTINPSAAAQRRYYEFLAEARRRVPGLQVVVTAGNHDAGARLEASSPVTAAVGAVVVGTVGRETDAAIDLDRMIVPLRAADGRVEVLVLAVPFLRPSDVPVVERATDPYLEGIAALYARLVTRAEAIRAERYPGAALLAIGHLHLQDAEESRDSERRVVIGGAEALSPTVFPPSLAYVALGHLHKPQPFENGRIAYCGSPIPLSFSEREYRHQVVEITFESGARSRSSELRIPRAVPLLRVPDRGAATVQQLPELLAQLPLDSTAAPEAHPFLELHVTEDGPNPDLRRMIEQLLAGKPVRLASIKRVTTATPGTTAAVSDVAAAADLNALQPDELLVEHHRATFGTDPDAAVLQAFREIVVATP